MALFAWLVFVPLQLLLLPFAVLGGAAVGYRQLVVSKRLGVSSTAIEILNARFTMAWFGLRQDPGAEKLAAVLENTSALGLQVALFPLWVVAKIAGRPQLYPVVRPEGEENLGNFIINRTVYIDRLLTRALPEVQQFVLLGAGYDTRCYGALDLHDARCFELDQERTQQHKRARLRDAGIDTSHVTYVTVDFARKDALERLTAAGFDPTKKSLFLWEGVTLYLSEEDILETLRQVHAHAPEGSTLVCDIYSQRMLETLTRGGGDKALEMTGEGLQFALPMEDARAELGELVGRASFVASKTYVFGDKTPKGGFMLVTALACSGASMRSSSTSSAQR